MLSQAITLHSYCPASGSDLHFGIQIMCLSKPHNRSEVGRAWLHLNAVPLRAEREENLVSLKQFHFWLRPTIKEG